MNHRPDREDVIILVTDGQPFGGKNSKQLAIDHAKKLKDKHIQIVGLGFADVNMETLKAISSPGKAVMGTVDNIDKELEKLVAGSCNTIRPAQSKFNHNQ